MSDFRRDVCSGQVVRVAHLGCSDHRRRVVEYVSKVLIHPHIPNFDSNPKRSGLKGMNLSEGSGDGKVREDGFLSRGAPG
eukprot:scaffold517803_cov27-Prasinocladus_malaysianus.AAC.1